MNQPPLEAPGEGKHNKPTTKGYQMSVYPDEFRAQPVRYPAPVQPPTVALTIVITLLFGIFGLIPAASASSKAAALGRPTGKYWGAFFGVIGAWFLLAVLVAAAGV